MKSFLLLPLFALAVSLPLQAEETPPVSVAVLDFQTSGEGLAGRGAEVAALLNANLSASPQVFLVERGELEKLLGEQELGLSGLVSQETSAKIGTLTGAKVLVTGRLFQTGEKYFLVAKVMSTETSRVYGETATFSNAGALDKATEELGSKVAAVIEKRGDTLVAKVEAPEAQIERLKKLVEGKTLPSISVTVAEQHLRQFVIDPAVETELILSLQKLGFKVIDAKASNEKADILISGEAFSELGGRKGNLIFCRARVELKVTESANAALVLADRQTGVGVDLAENVAGKNALENSARKLLDRIVPKLLK